MRVTTGLRPSERTVRRAARFASRLGVPFADRKGKSIARLSETGENEWLVVTENELRFVREGEPPFAFHPSLAMIRYKRFAAGESDLLLEACGVREGDRVLDCTAGLGADAIVLSCGAGPSGRVVALESEPVPYIVVKEGLAAYESGIPELDDAMRRIELIHCDHETYLKEQEDGSFDIVYFDPMFRRPIAGSEGLSPLRSVANGSPVRPEAVREARRVARRAVVLKERTDSGEFERLGFVPLARSHTKIAYGVISAYAAGTGT